MKKSAKPLVSIIILNWNGWEDTIECLESLYQIDYANYEVVLVDNGSEDDSIGKIKEYCRGKLKVKSIFFQYYQNNKPIKVFEYSKKETETKKLTIIKNDKNYGFAEGNNIGINHALNVLNPDYILLLNNDTVVDKEFLNELVQSMEKNPKIGFAGPKTYYYNYNGKKNVINFAGGYLNHLMGSAHHIGINEIDKNQYEKTSIVNFVEGSCILIRKEVLDKIGLFDTKYFAYWEEYDLCMRGLNQNYFSLYVAKAKIWHKVSSSSKGDTKIYYLTRNRFWFTKKYISKTQYTVFILYFFLFEFWFKCINNILLNKDFHFKCFIKGIKDGLSI